jgi:hypothetical protein
VYLAQHGGEPETVEKLRWLLAKSVRAFGRCPSVSRGGSRGSSNSGSWRHASTRRRPPVRQRRPAALLVATPEPVAGRPARTAGGRGRLRTLTSKNQRNKTATRLERKPHPSRRLRSVQHSGPPKRTGVSTTTSLAGGPDTISRLAGV